MEIVALSSLSRNRRAARGSLCSLLPALLACALVLFGSGCSIKRVAINKVGDALASGGSGFGSDDDPDLIRDAAPFSLKLMETLLAESPNHVGLRQASASGFTQYAYAFVQQEADEVEGKDLDKATAMKQRARRLYLRARNHGLAGLGALHRGFEERLRKQPLAAVAELKARDAGLAYWTAASWAAAISLSKNDPELIAQVPVVEALIDRAAALSPGFGDGSIQTFLITYEMVRQGGTGDPAARSRSHFDAAVKMSRGEAAAPFVSLAEAVSVKQQDRAEFESLLQRALAVNVDARPEWRLVNLVMQRRARWLLSRIDDLILPPLPPAGSDAGAKP